MARDHLILFVNGRRHDIRGERAFQSLSDFLRYDLRLTGTKVVCAEGDCASCTVLIGRSTGDGAISYLTVASCIQFLFQLDCTHIVTIEGLKYDGQLNPVQEAFVNEHGAQCGFCTPGFIVSLHALLEHKDTCDEPAIRRGLTGNLCRCTGYEPIIRSALATDRSRMRPIDDIHPPGPIAAVLARHSGDAVQVEAGSRRFFKPVTIEDAVKFRAAHTSCAIVTGGTDFGVQVNKGLRQPDAILSTAALPRFLEHHISDNLWTIGGGVTLSTLEREARTLLPPLAEMLDRFGSPQIRNAGTLAGNVANGSSIGDTLPMLFVLDAEIELAGVAGSRRVKINDFYTGYRRTLLAADELITHVHVPLPREEELLTLYKVSKRRDLDISSFTAAAWIKRDGTTISDIRLAFGGVGPTVVRMRRTENGLRGKSMSFAAFAAAADGVGDEVAPISDVRGSTEYRNRLAGNILLKLAFDLGFSSNGDDRHAHDPAGGNGHARLPEGGAVR